MFWAVNSTTKERVNSLSLEDNPSYEFIKEDIWFADIDEIESCPEEININEIKVRFREGYSTKNFNGTKYVVSPHFFIPNKKQLGINTIPETKEHKLAKNWIYNRLIKPNKKEFMINYSKLNKGLHFHQFNLLELPLDKSKINIETNSSLFNKTRRADIICPFIVRHPILGNGIVFEIQFSRQREKTRIDRELDWAIRGYSIAWLYEEDFQYLSESLIETKKESIDVDSFANLIKENKKVQIRDLKFAVQEESRKINNKIEDMKEVFDKYIDEIYEAKTEKIEVDEELIKNVIKRELDKLRKNFQPKCPKCNSTMILRRNRREGNQFWACTNYPVCTGSMEVMD